MTSAAQKNRTARHLSLRNLIVVLTAACSVVPTASGSRRGNVLIVDAAPLFQRHRRPAVYSRRASRTRGNSSHSTPTANAFGGLAAGHVYGVVSPGFIHNAWLRRELRVCSHMCSRPLHRGADVPRGVRGLQQWSAGVITDALQTRAQMAVAG